MTTVTVTVSSNDAAIAGATMRSLAALDRCGCPEAAEVFARVGQALSEAVGAVPGETFVADDRERIAVHAAQIAATQPLTAAALVRLLDGKVL